MTASRPQRTPPARSEGDNAAAASPGAADSASDRPPCPTPRSSTLATDPASLQAQLESLEQRFDDLKGQLRHLQKLSTLGTTAAMIAHEINNLLTPIMAYARHALDENDPERMRHALNKTLDCAHAMNRMVERVVGFARQADNARKPLCVRGVVEDALGCLARDFTKDQIDVHLKIDETAAVRANENQLLQVLINLITNARNAMQGRRGRLTFRAQPDDEDNLVIEIADTGSGIAPENLERVFDPFFSARPADDPSKRRGLGLGLPICRDIIQELGGTIALASELGVGTTFRITLPRAE